jgi:hypothetical protein
LLTQQGLVAGLTGSNRLPGAFPIRSAKTARNRLRCTREMGFSVERLSEKHEAFSPKTNRKKMFAKWCAAAFCLSAFFTAPQSMKGAEPSAEGNKFLWIETEDFNR